MLKNLNLRRPVARYILACCILESVNDDATYLLIKRDRQAPYTGQLVFAFIVNVARRDCQGLVMACWP